MKHKSVIVLMIAAGVSFSSSNSSNSSNVNATEAHYLLEGDILVYDSEDDDYYMEDSIDKKIRLWDKKGSIVEIPYKIVEGASPHHLSQIDIAIEEYTSKTCIRFINRTNEQDYVLVDPINYPMSCASAVGKKGGKQVLRCGGCNIDGNFHFGRIMHEMMHILGFGHENNRSDRDDYISVDYEALRQVESDDYIPDGTWLKKFKKCNLTNFGKKYGCKIHNNYDVQSITHYPSQIGTINPREVFASKKPCGQGGCQFGQREMLSQIDIRDIEKLYSCGIEFQQHERLCKSTVSLERESFCPYVNCTQLPDSWRLCPNHCPRLPASTNLLVVDTKDRAANAEILSMNGTHIWNSPCSADVPQTTGSGSNGVVLNSGVLICGGPSAYRTCQIISTNGSLLGAPAMRNGRRFHAMATISGRVIVVGGSDPSKRPMFSSEMFVNGSFINIKDLPVNSYGSCLTQLNDHEVILLSGVQSWFRSRDTWIYNINSDEWRQGPNLLERRKYHTCLSIKGANNQIERVIVMGGRSLFRDHRETVEILDVETMQFKYGLPLPKPIENFSSLVSYAEDSGGLIYVLGGRNVNKRDLSSIYVTSAKMLPNQTWVNIGDMNKRLSRFYTFLLPDQFFPQC